MTSPQVTGFTWFVLIGVAIGGLLAGAAFSPLPAGVTAPPRPTYRPTATATPHPTDTPHPTATALPVVVRSGSPARLELRLASGDLAVWTEVQWQDALGGWHMVEGWRGAPDVMEGDVAIKTWWVLPEHFGQGPFRWVVRSHPAEGALAVSAPFALPRHSTDPVMVTVVLKP